MQGDSTMCGDINMNVLYTECKTIVNSKIYNAWHAQSLYISSYTAKYSSFVSIAANAKHQKFWFFGELV